jgi:hypothetical protein
MCVESITVIIIVLLLWIVVFYYFSWIFYAAISVELLDVDELQFAFERLFTCTDAFSYFWCWNLVFLHMQQFSLCFIVFQDRHLICRNLNAPIDSIENPLFTSTSNSSSTFLFICTDGSWRQRQIIRYPKRRVTQLANRFQFSADQNPQFWCLRMCAAAAAIQQTVCVCVQCFH